MNSRVSSWRNKIAEVGDAAVKELLASEQGELNGMEETAEFIEFLLGDEHKNAPFLWESWGGGIKKTVRSQAC